MYLKKEVPIIFNFATYARGSVSLPFVESDLALSRLHFRARSKLCGCLATCKFRNVLRNWAFYKTRVITCGQKLQKGSMPIVDIMTRSNVPKYPVYSNALLTGL
jgi:hypothetical protein